MKLIAEAIKKAVAIGVKQFLENNKEFAPGLKIAQQSKNRVAKWAPKEFLNIELTEKDLKKSYKNQLKIYDEIISLNSENFFEEELPIIGEVINDQPEWYIVFGIQIDQRTDIWYKIIYVKSS